MKFYTINNDVGDAGTQRTFKVDQVDDQRRFITEVCTKIKSRERAISIIEKTILIDKSFGITAKKI